MSFGAVHVKEAVRLAYVDELSGCVEETTVGVPGAVVSTLNGKCWVGDHKPAAFFAAAWTYQVPLLLSAAETAVEVWVTVVPALVAGLLSIFTA
ncbi:hypothetical protein [Streptomyces aureus]|uniref:hypothetical protein n=1 Tax=Streptomyces aureus TaxID=193461 RepID=UPI0036CC0CB6